MNAPHPVPTQPPYQRILVFAAHPDDELRMAGTIAAFSAAGAEVFIAMVMNGSEGYPDPDMQSGIVELRRREADACDKVLGVSHRYHMDVPDMIGDGYTPERLKELIRIVREVRPEASFTHGPDDNHNDHRLVHRLSVDALWHAGEPVSANLGKPWKTAFRYYYKGVVGRILPTVEYDVTDTIEKRFEAAATQQSQFVLFGKSREALLEEGRSLKASGKRIRETFWMAERNRFAGFPTIRPPATQTT